MSGVDIITCYLPPEDADAVQFYEECLVLYNGARSTTATLSALLAMDKAGQGVTAMALDCTSQIKVLVDGMVKMNQYTADTSSLLNHKISCWRQRLWVERLAISQLLYNIICRFLDSELVEVTLRLAHLYNETLSLSGSTHSINVFSNACPMLLYPLRKLNATRLLQILAQKRAESSCFLLLDGLLYDYAPLGTHFTEDFPPAPSPSPPPPTVFDKKRNSVSSDTSVEIFRALTEHLDKTLSKGDKQSLFLKSLLKLEEQRVTSFLSVTVRIAPQLLSAHCVKPSSVSGESKLKTSVRKKLVHYFQDVLWSEVGDFLEHVLLWWSTDPLGSFSPTLAQHLREYLSNLLETGQTEKIPLPVTAATRSLIDALACHITSTSWDQHFRHALVAAANLPGYKNSGFTSEGTNTGLLFLGLLQDLVKLNNTCENLHLDLDQLPLVEQIPVLHRLDHSVHTTRLWAGSRCRQLATVWRIAQFYSIAHTDITKCLDVLNKLELLDHGKIPASAAVHVAVCAKMRAKLVSEVKDNVLKLRGTLAECIDVLASGCRTHCLAYLHMSFPPSRYWRQSGPLPDCASEYVENYLDFILRPVLTATETQPHAVQLTSAGMILRISCESWLEYIHLHRIKFSEWGAVQLLTDFGAVPTWLMERVKLPKELLNSLLNHEVLRRCEGVGRLLLRRPGESIAMTAPLGHRTSGNEDKPADNMPAEMYVTNQEQWLELRAPRTVNICCQL